MTETTSTFDEERIRGLVAAGWAAFYDRRARWLRSVVARLKGITTDLPEVLDLNWRMHYLEGNLDAAMDEAAHAVDLYPDDADLQHALGWCLLELRSAEEAIPHLRRACELQEGHADGWYNLGIALEQLSDGSGVRSAFTRVHQLDSEQLSKPNHLPPEEFERVVSAAIDELPEPVVEAMEHVAVIVEDYPGTWILESPPYDPRLFGLFTGATFAESRSSSVFTIDEPTRIYLFQRNLERQFGHPLDLQQEIRITLIHEVGHFLGLNEEELAQRGWL